jgi:hypothetical protein
LRVTEEYLSLQLAYDPSDLQSLFLPERLTTARFEPVYRETSGYGMLDLIFEDAGKIFIAHAVGVDVVVLATLEGPVLVWPATLRVSPEIADAVEELVTPWLLALTRGRGLAGEYVREYRPSSAFARARELGLYGATVTGETLPRMAPFVYARRFARGRDVCVACADGALAAAVIGTVARSIVIAAPRDEFARRWYGEPAEALEVFEPEVAVIDDPSDAYPRSAAHVITTRAHPAARTIVIPVPVPNDHLFTFDPADAPAAASFGVRARDGADRPTRSSVVPEGCGGSDGRVALVVRDDAFVAEDADTDSVLELARRLQTEGIDAFTVTADDERISRAHIVHIFGGIDDKHVLAAADIAQRHGLPFVLSLEPLAPYATYYEGASIVALRLGADDGDKRRYLRLFHQARLRLDDIPHERDAAVAEGAERTFERVCDGAIGIILAPGDDVTAFCARFPRVDAEKVHGGTAFLAAEPDETSVAELVPAERFLLIHGPISQRSAFGPILASLGEAGPAVVVAGPMSEVDCGFTLRRVAGSGVVFLPDPTPGEVAALYRRAHAVAFPPLRPTGVSRLLRAVLCGALPLVPSSSPLARLVPPAFAYDPWSPTSVQGVVQKAMVGADFSELVSQLGRALAPLADQRGAFTTVMQIYALAAAVASR